MGIGLIPISQGMTSSQPELDEALKDLAFCVLGTYSPTRAPSIICDRVHMLMLLPLQYTVIGAGVDLTRRLFYVSVESPDIPDVPMGHAVPHVRVVYETATWSPEKNRHVPCPMRLVGITRDESHDPNPWTMPTVLDGYTPESLRAYMKIHAKDVSLKEILVGVIKEHPEFFDLLPENNNACADYLNGIITDFFEIRWRRQNGILW